MHTNYCNRQKSLVFSNSYHIQLSKVRDYPYFHSHFYHYQLHFSTHYPQPIISSIVDSMIRRNQIKHIYIMKTQFLDHGNVAAHRVHYCINCMLCYHIPVLIIFLLQRPYKLCQNPSQKMACAYYTTPVLDMEY